MTDNASAKSGGSFITALFATTIPTSPYLVGLAQREEKARPIVSQYGASRMSKFAALRDSCLMLGFCVVMAIASSAQTYAVLFSFDGMNGAYPDTGLIQATNGNFYGVTYGGGAPSGGTVFEITPGGVMTVLYSFCSQPSCSDSSGPLGGLIQATDGNFYGTTWGGGSASNCGSPLGCGTIFRITSGGVLTSLYSFCSQPDCADGADPTSLIQATDGNLYGITTYAGGAHDSGTVFQMTLAGTLTTLHRFHGVDGATPGALIQATDGNLYGVATTSGTNGHGTVFRITPGGSLTTVYSFCAQTKCADGADPSSLIQARDGNLYGTTTGGGTLNHGTVYQITQGALTTLHSFVGSQGVGPEALMQAADGNFYGMTARGGPTGDGTIFEIGAGGALATLYNFCSQSGCPEGGFPSRLIQATGGSFYGTTGNGGAYNYGTVFTFGPPVVALSKTSLSFGDQALNEIGAAKTVTLTSSGTDLLTFNNVAINGNCAISANSCTGAALAAGQSCKVSVTFTPTALGPQTGTLTFTDNALNGPQRVTLSGTGVVQAALTPSRYTFSKTKVGDTSTAREFILKSNLTSPLTGISYSTEAPFAVSAATCGTTLDSKKSCSISVTFSPTQTGTATGTLTVSDNANNSPQTASLSGTGD